MEFIPDYEFEYSAFLSRKGEYRYATSRDLTYWNEIDKSVAAAEQEQLAATYN